MSSDRNIKSTNREQPNTAHLPEVQEESKLLDGTPRVLTYSDEEDGDETNRELLNEMHFNEKSNQLLYPDGEGPNEAMINQLTQ